MISNMLTENVSLWQQLELGSQGLSQDIEGGYVMVKARP